MRLLKGGDPMKPARPYAEYLLNHSMKLEVEPMNRETVLKQTTSYEEHLLKALAGPIEAQSESFIKGIIRGFDGTSDYKQILIRQARCVCLKMGYEDYESRKKDYHSSPSVVSPFEPQRGGE